MRCPRTYVEVLAAAAAARRPTESLLGDWPALEQASEAGLIELTNDEVRFTHPLLASAAYGSVTAAERRRLHRRLAEVVSDPEERARHLALGAEGPDDEVADMLEDAARRAAARGAAAEAAELAELAVRLTPTSERGRLLERRVDAAGYHLPTGELDTAAKMLEHLVEELPPGGARADALLLLASAQQSFERCLQLAESALGEARDDDARVAKIECYIGEVLLVQGSSDQALEHARAALKPAERAGDRTILATALSTVAWFETLSAVEPTPGLLERAVALEEAAVQSRGVRHQQSGLRAGHAADVRGTTRRGARPDGHAVPASGLARRRSRGGGRPPAPGPARAPRRQLAARRAACGGRV